MVRKSSFPADLACAISPQNPLVEGISYISLLTSIIPSIIVNSILDRFKIEVYPNRCLCYLFW
jgi:hypothetical protein